MDYDSDNGRRRSPAKIKGRGHARFGKRVDYQGRGGVFETIPQDGLKRGGPAQCEFDCVEYY